MFTNLESSDKVVFPIPYIFLIFLKSTTHIFSSAIAWSPHHHGLLASGGGTADRCIRFWNTLTGQPMQCVDTGSQVCNLAWSKHASELVSGGGYGGSSEEESCAEF